MSVRDLADEYKLLYLMYLEDWPDEITEVDTCKEHWYRKMKDNGFRVELAMNKEGEISGMIQYDPIWQSSMDGNNRYFFY